MTSPCSTPAWIAAPMATTSSGLTLRLGSLPKNCLTVSITLGIRVMPPTRITSLISGALSPASFSALRHGPIVRWIRSSTKRFELGAGQFDIEVLGPVLVGGDERQIDVGLHRRRQLDLGLLRRLFQPLQGEAVGAQVDPLLLFELVGQIIDDVLVEVFAAEKSVAVGRFDLEHAVADFEHRDVEGAAAEIIDRDRAGCPCSPCRRRVPPRSAR